MMEGDSGQGPPSASETGQYRSRRERAERPTKRNTPAWRRQRFVRAYLANGGYSTRAAITAGFAAKNASAIASRLLKEPEVQAELAQAQAKSLSDADLTIALSLRELVRIAASDPRKYFDDQGRMLQPAEWDDTMASAVSSIESEELYEGKGKHRKLVGHTRKIKFWSKSEAIDKAMKYLGLFEANNQQRAGSARRSLEITFVAGPKRDQAVITEGEQPERLRLPSRVKPVTEIKE